MDPGEDVRIERVTRQKNGRPGEELEVLLSDASSFFASMRSWERRPFHADDRITMADVERLKRESGLIAVRSRAMDLLARSDHSAFLLHRKLVSRGHDSSIVAEVITDLKERGMLNDRRFAESWVRDRVRRHPEAEPMLVAGLRHRGVDSATAEAAVPTVLEELGLSADDLIRGLIPKLLRGRGVTPAVVSAKLYRRGFAPPLIRRVVAEFTSDQVSDEE